MSLDIFFTIKQAIITYPAVCSTGVVEKKSPKAYICLGLHKGTLTGK